MKPKAGSQKQPGRALLRWALPGRTRGARHWKREREVEGGGRGRDVSPAPARAGQDLWGGKISFFTIKRTQ